MKNEFTAVVSTTIDAKVFRVWEALTDPKLIKKYFFGTEAVSDFKEGSGIVFRGEWEGQPYEDHGVITKVTKNKEFRFRYWSSRSGLPDTPENYVNITYELTEKQDKTGILITQENIPSAEMKEHAEQSWRTVLKGLKRLLEKAHVDA